MHGLIDFGDAPVFDAIAYPTIVLLERNPPHPDASFRGYTWQPGPPVEEFATIFRKQAFDIPQKSLHKGGWRLEDSAKRNLLDKLRAGGTPLGEYCEGRFYYGIKTGLNDAFVVDRETRDRLIAEHASSNEVLKPYLRGRDVKQWCATFADLWLIYVPWHFPLHHDNSIRGASAVAEKQFKSKYPAIYQHLLKYKNELSARNKAETGIRYEWYALQRWGADYWNEFDEPKIITGRFMDKPTFAYDDHKRYNNNANSFIAGAKPFLAALLNNAVTWAFLRKTCTDLQNGYLQAHNENIAAIPIPTTDKAEQVALEKLVQTIVKSKEANATADVSAWEAEINARVYRLFHLTPDEIATIEATA